MGKTSAGLLVYRRQNGELQVLLVHPGGPFWVKRDLGAWSIPKGEVDAAEPLLDAAKTVHAWAVPGDCDPARLRSNTFSLEWPPRSGMQREFPEIDRAAWFPINAALRRILPGQAGFLRELATLV